MTIHVSLISTVRINKEAPSGADLDMKIYHNITVRINIEVLIGADLDMTISLIRINKEVPIGANLDMTISLISTVKINKEQKGPNWCRS